MKMKAKEEEKGEEVSPFEKAEPSALDEET